MMRRTKKLKDRPKETYYFTESEIEQLFDLIHQRITSPSDKQKRIREKMRKLGFFGHDDWGIYDLHAKDMALLIQERRIKIIKNKIPMTLHEAMIIVLKEQKNHTMHRAELANEIERKGLYQKGDKTPISPNQISGRVSKYSHLFKTKDGNISLI